jgi:hypothetical protein
VPFDIVTQINIKNQDMKNINNDVFLNKIMQRIKNGDFDAYLTLPFMTRDLLVTTIKGKLTKKVETGGTPILSDADLKDCIADVKESAVYIVAIYLKLGFIIKTETGYEFTPKGNLAVKAAHNL